jgi:hypothetical protein
MNPVCPDWIDLESEIATKEDEMTTTKTAKDKSLKPCTCSLFEVGEEFETDGQPDRSIFTTNCDRKTNNRFAQGHDAKLVGFLVRAHLDGQTIWQQDGGILITFGGPVEAAGAVSASLAAKAEKMLATAAKKAEAKAVREAAKTAKKDAAANQNTLRPLTEEEGRSVMEQIFAANPPHEEPAPVVIKGKVGRWTYEGTELNGAFHYTPKLGGPKVAPAGTWARV